MAASAIASPAPPAPPAPPDHLATPAVREAVRRAWASSPDIQAADAERRAAAARVNAAAQPVYNPTLSLEGENADVDRRTIGASLALDLGGKRRARTSEAEAALGASEAAYAIRRRNVASAWLKAWTGSLLATRQDELGRRRLDLMRRFDRLAAKRLAVGDIGAPERDLAALARGEAEIQQATLAGQEAAARASLAAVDATTGGSLPPLPAALPPSADTVIPRDAEDRPEMLEALAQQRRADAAIEVARSQRRPDPTVAFTGGRVRVGSRSDRVIGLSVSLPLPVLNTGRADLVAASAAADAVTANRRAVLLRSNAELARQRTSYAALRSAAEAFRASRASAFDERTALLEQLWQAGEIGTSDYLVQLKQSLDTALSGLALEAQAWQAWFDYLSASGHLTEWIDTSPKDVSP
jgi:cobalt-zinc-cadmium efflux system outer membrane protein